MPHDSAILDALRAVTTATLTTVLLKKGLRRSWMRGPKPLYHAHERLVGPAFTLPFRTHARGSRHARNPGPRRAPPAPRSKTCRKGAVAIVDAMGIDDAGIFGDILCARMHKRGVAGLITDGVVRDGVGVSDTGLPVWASGVCRAGIGCRG